MSAVADPNLVYIPSRWHYRFIGNVVVLGFIASICFVTLMIKTDFVVKQLGELNQQVLSLTSYLGFTLDDVLITGRERTSKPDIEKALSLSRGDNILQIDIQKIKTDLETLPWVKTALVKRSLFPNIIQISIIERKVKALWQIHDRFYPIDTNGNVINAKFSTNEPILLIVGQNAPENITELLEVIQQDPELAKRIKVANFISERRWNLVLDDIKKGITIKLPENDIDAAWKRLIKLNSSKGLLKRKLTIIDLRFEDKIILKLEKTKQEAPESKA